MHRPVDAFVSLPLEHSGRSLSRLALLVGTLMVVFAVVLGVTDWRSVREDQGRQLDTALELSEKALDRFFVQSEAGLRELAFDIEAGGGLADLAAAQRQLRRYAELHSESSSITLIRPDGQLLASSTTASLDGLPSLAGQASFQASLRSMRAGARLQLDRPLLGLVSKAWVFPMRYPVLARDGTLLCILSASVPVALLEGFWRAAPVVDRVSIGLLRDDGYLLSRYPVPGARGPEDVYGNPRSGALRQHLVDRNFPARGYVEGRNQLAGIDFANDFMRLEHYPVTLFVSMPIAEFRAAWWQRVRAPYGLIVAFGLIGTFGYVVTRRRQLEWELERRRNEASLRESEEQQRSLVDHLVAGVIVHDVDGVILAANPAARALLGLSDATIRSQATTAAAWELFRDDGDPLPADEYPVVEAIRTRRSVDDRVVGVRHASSDVVVWIVCSCNPEIDGEGRLLRVVVTFVDITARRAAERTLERSERRFRLLYENNLDAVLGTRPDGAVLAANPAACAMFGTDEATIIGLGRTGLVPDGESRFAEIVEERRVRGYARGVMTLRRADGALFEADAATVAYVDAQETYCSWVLRDLTDRRAAEVAIAAREKAEHANRAKSEFIAHMSHELRTPLNAILGFSAVLQMYRQPPLAAVHLAQVGHIQSAGKHLLAMINDLLDLSSLESGAMKLRVEAIDPWKLMMLAVRDVAERAEAAGVTIDVWPPLPATGRMLGDGTRFSQVVLNLLSNAVKYNRPGGDVKIRLQAGQDRLQLTVADTGLGMRPDQLALLFQPFNRLGREGSAIEGTGIGLVVTKTLVELMGGQLTVRSDIDEGSEFCVALPIVAVPQEAASDAPATSAAVPQARDGEGDTCSVLYIDDDPINCLLVKALMGMRTDVSLSIAANGAEGVAKALSGPPDLVLSDMRMAGMNGIDVLRELRRHACVAATRIVAVSANAMPGEISAALEAGFDDYLTKPVPAEILFREVDRTLAALAAAAMPRARRRGCSTGRES